MTDCWTLRPSGQRSDQEADRFASLGPATWPVQGKLMRWGEQEDECRVPEEV